MPRSTTFCTRFGHIFIPLNATERAVLLLVADGAANRDIAAELNYSVGHIKTVSESIFRKLNVTSRITAVNVAVLVGEIPCPHCQRRHVFTPRSVRTVKQMRQGRYVRTYPDSHRSEA